MSTAIYFPAPDARGVAPRPHAVTVTTMRRIHTLVDLYPEVIAAEEWTAYICPDQSELLACEETNTEASVFLNRNYPGGHRPVVGPVVVTGPELTDSIRPALAHHAATLYRELDTAAMAAVWTPDTFRRIVGQLDLRESLALTRALPALAPA